MAPFVRYLDEDRQKKPGTHPFVAPPAERWGFGSVFERRRAPNGWMQHRCPLPVIRSTNNGKERIDWGQAFDVMFSFSILFQTLEMLAEYSNTDRNQLCIPKIYERCVSVDISRTFVEWIRGRIPEKLSDERHGVYWTLNDVNDAMCQAHRLMWPPHESERFRELDRFTAQLKRPAVIHFDIPGDACGLDPDQFAWTPRDRVEGYSLHPHNVDSPLQQLTLLVGLAAVCDLIRQPLH